MAKQTSVQIETQIVMILAGMLMTCGKEQDLDE
jgi:hypothetical protein